jgi:LysR family transcriptional regulator, transcriptional activator of the cysJI operon
MLQYSVSSLMVFATVARYRSFSRAADVLFMTQPGVSNHIAQLEAQTGLTLIKRERGRFELTKDGKIVCRYAERVERITRELGEVLRVLRKDVEPSLRIGTTVNYAKKIMPYILGDFQRKNPDIRIKLDAGASAEMEKTLLSGRNNVIIVANRHDSMKIQSFPFVREELVLIVSTNHPLAERIAVSLADIRLYPFIIREEGSATRSIVLTAFSKIGAAPSVLIEVNSTEFIKEWVAQGKGVSILIRRAVNVDEDTSLAMVPLVEPLFLEVAVAYLKSKKHDPSVQRFIVYLKELIANPDPATVLVEAGTGATERV